MDVGTQLSRFSAHPYIDDRHHLPQDPKPSRLTAQHGGDRACNRIRKPQHRLTLGAAETHAQIAGKQVVTLQCLDDVNVIAIETFCSRFEPSMADVELLQFD
jgi:hypothetical protein